MSNRPAADLISGLRARETSALMKQARAHYAAGNFKQAVMTAQEALKRSPDHAAALLLLGEIAHRTGSHGVAANLYSRILARDDSNAAAHAGLADTDAAAGRWADAAERLRRAITLSPKEPNYHVNLGALLVALGDRDAAGNAFRRALKLDPRHKRASHMLAGLAGEVGAKDNTYIQGIFDEYASYFDKHLVDTLHYRTPWLIAEAMKALHPAPFAAVLDLGCGTGLIGDALDPSHAAIIDGIDLSPRMIDATRAKGRYRTLSVHDIEHALGLPEFADGSYDLVTAADVFVYIGPLDAIVRGVHRKLVPGGYFAFTVEHAEGNGFSIQASSRYAHGEDYTANLHEASGLKLETKQVVALRKDNQADIAGRIEIWRRV